MGEVLARIVGDPERLQETVAAAALATGDADAHEEMFVRVHPDRIETPANARDATQVSFCTARAGRFEAVDLPVDPPVDALFDVQPVLDWLDWLAPAPSLTVTLEGNTATGITDRLVFTTDREEVTVPCATDWRREDLSLTMPERFAGGQFLDTSGGPVPTRVQVEVEALQRVVEATHLATGGGEYRLRFRENGLVFVARGPDGVRARGSLDATVHGPSVEASYGPGFARVVSSLAGQVALQTGPGEALAIVKDSPDFTLRFVVYPV